MSHVFISYARSTEAAATGIAQALRDLGFKVWRDDQLPANRAYADVIEERLNEAAVVLVLWSAEAAKSHWVRAEADKALNLGSLVQVTLDGTLPPMPFNQVQCAKVTSWDGSSSSWTKLLESIADLAGGAPLKRARNSAPAVAPLPARRGKSICVLPFQNMSGDAEQEYFSDGISEDIITDLSKVSSLSVIARNTAFTFKGRSVDVVAVAAQLHVSHVLEGSVRRAGNRVRITAQLVDGMAGDHVWAERWDRELTDIFALQDEISQAIVSALRVRLTARERESIESRGTTSLAAYDLYLLARQLWVAGNEGDRTRDVSIIRLCRQAVEIDPAYARAWALLALAQTELRFRHGAAEEDGVEAAEKALQADPNLAEAHAVKARYLAEQGHDAESEAAIRAALLLDPDSWEVNREAGTLAFRSGRFTEAASFFEKATASMPTDYFSPGFLVVTYSALDRQQDARRCALITVERTEKAVEQNRGNGAALAHGAYSYGCLGQGEKARAWTQRALLVDPQNLITRYRLACLFANQLADGDGAVELLGPYFETCSAQRVSYAERDPDLHSLRNRPDFRTQVAAAKTRLNDADRPR